MKKLVHFKAMNINIIIQKLINNKFKLLKDPNSFNMKNGKSNVSVYCYTYSKQTICENIVTNCNIRYLSWCHKDSKEQKTWWYHSTFLWTGKGDTFDFLVFYFSFFGLVKRASSLLKLHFKQTSFDPRRDASRSDRKGSGQASLFSMQNSNVFSWP